MPTVFHMPSRKWGRMELSIREAAVLLGRSPRTVRAWAASGEIPAFKKGGQWRVRKQELPLTGVQRKRLEQRAERVVDAVKGAVGSRRSQKERWTGHRLAELEPFRLGLKVFRALQATDAVATPKAGVDSATELVAEALLLIGEGAHQFERNRKLIALARSRALLGRAAAQLLVDACDSQQQDRQSIVEEIEGEVIPALAALMRWAERLPDGKDRR